MAGRAVREAMWDESRKWARKQKESWGVSGGLKGARSKQPS